MLVVVLIPSLAMATVTVTQGTSAPTYSTTLTFDEPGGPTGAVPADAFLASHGISSFVSGVGAAGVGNLSATMPWLPNNNVAEGPFGLFVNFANDLSELSLRAWDNSGPPSPFGGGMAVVVLNNGTELAFNIFNPAFGGVGNEYYNITTSGGMVFDEIRVLGFGFVPVTWGDDFSWNVVPEPTSMSLLGLASLALMRFRRGRQPSGDM
jgi:hypothetical protein